MNIKQILLSFNLTPQPENRVQDILIFCYSTYLTGHTVNKHFYVVLLIHFNAVLMQTSIFLYQSVSYMIFWF